MVHWPGCWQRPMAYNDFLKIRTWSLEGSKTEHITEKVQAKTWSGSCKDCARQLSFSALPEALLELGGMARLYLGADILFSGHIVSRSRDSLGQVIDCAALDNGLYPKQNSTHSCHAQSDAAGSHGSDLRQLRCTLWRAGGYGFP